MADNCQVGSDEHKAFLGRRNPANQKKLALRKKEDEEREKGAGFDLQSDGDEESDGDLMALMA